MTTQPTPAPTIRKFSKEALARLVEESYWPLGGALERLEMLDLDVQIERLHAELVSWGDKCRTQSLQLAGLTDAELTKKLAEWRESSAKWDAVYTRLEALRKRRFPA